VVFLKVSTQRPQLATRLKRSAREIATPPRSTAVVVVKRSGGSKRRLKPRTSSPLRSGPVETRTRMPPNPRSALDVVSRIEPVSTRGAAPSWTPYASPLAVGT